MPPKITTAPMMMRMWGSLDFFLAGSGAGAMPCGARGWGMVGGGRFWVAVGMTGGVGIGCGMGFGGVLSILLFLYVVYVNFSIKS
jgi:hypothetical protein